MPTRHDGIDDEYDEITREIAFGGRSDPPEPRPQEVPADPPDPRPQAAGPAPAPPPRRLLPTQREPANPLPVPARERVAPRAVPEPAPTVDGVETATMVASTVLAGAITDERRPGQFSGAFEIWTCPPEAIEPVRNAIGALGLPVDRRPIPPGQPGYLRGVPREAIEIDGQPSAMVAAIADALRDDELMQLIGTAMEHVRFGRESTVGRRGAVVHSIRVEPADGEALQIGSGAPVPWARVLCPCGTNTELMPGREALVFAGVHVRLEIEAALQLLGQQPPPDLGPRLN